MTRFILPVILIGISIAVFSMFTSPIYNQMAEFRAKAASYNEALSNSKTLENERDKLTTKYNSISPDDLLKLQKLLPENINNIRLILEIEQIAMPYGMVLKNVKYSVTSDKDTPNKGASSTSTPSSKPRGSSLLGKDYGVWDLEFSTAGTYSNFLNFLRDLESNLRIVDISSIQFSSGADTKLNSSPSSSNSSPSEAYKYDFKIKTYWLKN